MPGIDKMKASMRELGISEDKLLLFVGFSDQKGYRPESRIEFIDLMDIIINPELSGNA